MNARIGRILTFALIAGCGGGGSAGPPETPSKFLYASASGGPNSFPTDIYGFAVYSSGALSAVPGSPASGADDGSIGRDTITRDSKFLYTTTNVELEAFQINSDGSLTNAPSPSFSLFLPASLVAHPTADFLYVGTTSGVLSVLAINPETGALKQTSSASLGSNIEVGNFAVITPDGRYLYQGNLYPAPAGIGPVPTQLQLAGFSIDSATGALSAVPGSPESLMISSNTDTSITAMAADPTGKFLFAGYEFDDVAGFDGAVAAFSIDASSGALTAIPGSPFSIGGVPNSVAIDASGSFLIVSISPRLGGAPGNCLAVLSIDAHTGALASVPGSPFGPQSCGPVTADPSEPFVYAGVGSATGPAAVLVLSLDQTTGTLATIGQTAVPDSTKVNVSGIALTH
jgi:6-phosphogluconolactonase